MKNHNYFLKEYQWLNTMLLLMSNKKKIPINEINLCGGRFSGKSTAIQVFIGLLCMLDLRLGIVFIRASKQGGIDLMDDIISTFESFDIPYKVHQQRGEIYVGQNKIKVIGLNSLSKYGAKKSGFPRFNNVDYIIKVFEECFEFKKNEHQAIQEAIRHNLGDDPQYLTINICNPWARSNWFIEYCESYQRFDEMTLKTVGSQIGKYEFMDNETYLHQTKLFQYTNWRVTREHLTKEQILQIKQYWSTDRNRALVADYGMPGFEFGAIYSTELHKIAEPFYTNEPQYMLCGMDYGWSQQEGNGKTSCIFGSGTSENGLDIYGEFVWDNSKQPIEPNALCKRVIEFIQYQTQKFMSQTAMIYPPKIVCRVDNSEIGIIQLLNNLAQQYGYSTWLSFVPCKKYPTMDRISVVLGLMGAGKFRMDKDCINLMRELEFSHYDEKGEKKRIKQNDHSLNAMEYAIEPLLYKWPSMLGLDTKIFKKRGIANV